MDLQPNYRALATDYDGTLAQDGHVDAETLAALEQLRRSGRKVILVTGRELPELQNVFPEIGVCDVVVAENGGLLFWPGENREELLGEAVPVAFVAEMTRRDVTPFSVGRTIFATWRPHETTILEAIQQLGLGHQIIFNKRAVMVLPANVNKASGLVAALDRLRIPPGQVVGVGDAENDHAFLEVCGLSAAVANALPAVKERCQVNLLGDHGRGVQELVAALLGGTLGPAPPANPSATSTHSS